ncbi:MAG TPA: fibrobacter succinogenes major paralogous domain-containing protein [Lacibacter sp.]|nr:fibrobacter succinogenes major paralogous domain-containing protein [Lacibacter sp.]HMO90124.1 fibrobacter succinogenes major paralogous domain-containing protein [Lacibacter sp.]HMP85857.1 fibrobacter succinogenes major paralogous domain-containing protein [Lacibacter sp.]
MRKTHSIYPLLTLFIAIITLTAFQQQKKESQPDNPIGELVIGNQTWMQENLNVERFRNGDTIPEARTIQDWRLAGRERKPAWCYYNNDPANGAKYGKLYNYFAVADPRGLAPEGWRVPSQDDWFVLMNFLGGKKARRTAGNELKSTSGWLKGGNGTNSTGFNARPGGWRDGVSFIIYKQGFLGEGHMGYWWATDYFKRTLTGLAISLSKADGRIFRDYEAELNCGFSVRCIKE